MPNQHKATPQHVKTQLVTVLDGDAQYQCLKFICPGCALDGSTGMHMLPVNCNNHEPSWNFDGNLDAPTLSPSILTRGGPEMGSRCHSYLEAGKFRFLEDSTHELAGQTDVPLPDLPDWALEATTDG